MQVQDTNFKDDTTPTKDLNSEYYSYLPKYLTFIKY